MWGTLHTTLRTPWSSSTLSSPYVLVLRTFLSALMLFLSSPWCPLGRLYASLAGILMKASYDSSAMYKTSSFFRFNGQFYEQTDGVAMGSPLSPVIADFFMEHFEETVLDGAIHKPLCWFRYVDDTFVIWPPWSRQAVGVS
jgi:hypothetical protein